MALELSGERHTLVDTTQHEPPTMHSIAAHSQILAHLHLPAVTVGKASLLLGPALSVCPVDRGSSVELCTVNYLLSPHLSSNSFPPNNSPLDFQQFKHTQVLFLLKHAHTEHSLTLFFPHRAKLFELCFLNFLISHSFPSF